VEHLVEEELERVHHLAALAVLHPGRRSRLEVERHGEAAVRGVLELHPSGEAHQPEDVREEPLHAGARVTSRARARGGR
jgi:hypothetical protein